MFPLKIEQIALTGIYDIQYQQKPLIKMASSYKYCIQKRLRNFKITSFLFLEF